MVKEQRNDKVELSFYVCFLFKLDIIVCRVASEYPADKRRLRLDVIFSVSIEMSYFYYPHIAKD